MRRSLLAFASLALTALWSTAPLAAVASKIDKMSPEEKAEKSKPLFAVNHPNITYLTDDNWDATMIQYSDRPWLVDFYHPFCPYCRRFAPVFEEAAAYFKADGRIYVGAISCMDHYKCSRIKIKGFPNLVAFNFDKKRPTQEVYRIFGSHTVQQMKDLVNRLFAEAAYNETGSYPPPSAANGVPAVVDGNASATTAPPPASSTTTEVKPDEPEIKEQWEESTSPMNQTTRLQDAASAFIFGLKQGVFTGREVLEDVELDALKMWLALVSKTFPGSINRKLIAKLSDEVASIPLLDMDTWHTLLKDWQAKTVDDFMLEESQLSLNGVDVPEWQRLNDLFIGQGVEYEACALYTCGQWNMFHMLTMNPPVERDPKLVVDVIATIRRFVKHFFGCIECRDHFLKYNNLEMVQKISAAEDKPLALKRWLWNMHNAVNKRINHPLWPKPDICPTCGSEGNWLEVEVDKWLGNTYEYREVHVPRVTTEPPATTTPPAELLRKEDDEPHTEKVIAVSDTTTPPPITTQPPSETTPVDVDNGDSNLTTVQQAQQDEVGTELLTTKVSAGYEFQTSHLVWFALPVAVVAGYLLFVRSSGRTTYQAVPGSEPTEETVL